MSLLRGPVDFASVAAVRCMVNAHHTRPNSLLLSHGILKLPAEVIQEIAFHALPEDPRPLQREAPLSVSQVCSSWRQAIINLPVAWQQIRLELYLGFRFSAVCDSLIQYFGRAGGRGLILHLVFHQDRRHPATWSIDPEELTPSEQRQLLSYNPRRVAQKDALKFLKWLFAQQLTARIQKLQVTTTMHLDRLLEPNASPPNVSRLECLKFNRPPIFSNSPITPVGLGGILKNAPVLRCLILSGTSLDGDILNSNTLPLNQLRFLYLSIPLSDGQVIGLLDTSPSLERLRVVVSTSELDLKRSRPNHQNLVDFEIRLDRNTVDLFGILHHRTFEKLSSLHINLNIYEDTLYLNPTKPSASHTMPNLHRLYIHAPSQELHLKFFQNHPQLTHLFVDADISRLDSLTGAFADPSDQQQRYWPPIPFTNLQSLTLAFLNVEVFDDEAHTWYDRFPEHQEVVNLLEALLSRTKYSQQRLSSTTEPLTTCRLSLYMKESPDRIEPIARAVAELGKELDLVLDTSAREIFAIKSIADDEWFDA